jgi:O-antigen/teichoic acid export membrane protein
MIRTIAQIFGTRVWVSLSGLALYVALARLMGPELQGLVSFSIMLVALLVMGTNLGLESSAVYFINRKGMSVKGYLKLIIPAVLSGALLSAMVLLVLSRSGLVGLDDTGTLLLVLILFPLDAVIHMSRYLFLSRQRFKEYNGIDRVQSAALIIFVGTMLAFWPDSVVKVLSGYLMARLVALLYIAVHSRKGEGQATATDASIRLKEILGFSMFPWMGNFFAVLGVRLDTILVAWFVSNSKALSAADLGYYTVCMMALSRLQDLQMSIQNAYFPKVASLPMEEARSLAAQFYRLTWLLYFGVFLVVVALGYPVLAIFGSEYTTAFPAFSVMAFGMLVIRANTGVIALFFTSTGKPHIPAFVNAAGTVASLLAGLYFIPRFGLLGAASGLLAAALMNKVLLAVLFSRSLRTYQSMLLLGRSDLRLVRKWLMEKLRSSNWTDYLKVRRS